MITAWSNHRNRSTWTYFRMRKTSGSMEKYNIISRCVIAGRACFPASRPGWFPTELVSLFPYRRPYRFLEFYKGHSSSLLEYPKNKFDTGAFLEFYKDPPGVRRLEFRCSLPGAPRRRHDIFYLDEANQVTERVAHAF